MEGGMVNGVEGVRWDGSRRDLGRGVGNGVGSC